MADGRSSGARRLKDILRALIVEAGGDPVAGLLSLPLPLQLTIRTLATVSAQLEALQARSLSGELINALHFTRMINAQRRIQREYCRLLEPPKEPKKPGPKPR